MLGAMGRQERVAEILHEAADAVTRLVQERRNGTGGMSPVDPHSKGAEDLRTPTDVCRPHPSTPGMAGGRECALRPAARQTNTRNDTEEPAR